MMSTDDQRPTSDFPEEDLTPVRRHTESQALIRLQRENTGPVEQLDGPEIEPLTPLSAPEPRMSWLPWLIIGLLLVAGIALWVYQQASDKQPSGARPAPVSGPSTQGE
jgi:hypothetical protein